MSSSRVITAVATADSGTMGVCRDARGVFSQFYAGFDGGPARKTEMPLVRTWGWAPIVSGPIPQALRLVNDGACDLFDMNVATVVKHLDDDVTAICNEHYDPARSRPYMTYATKDTQLLLQDSRVPDSQVLMEWQPSTLSKGTICDVLIMDDDGRKMVTSTSKKGTVARIVEKKSNKVRILNHAPVPGKLQSCAGTADHAAILTDMELRLVYGVASRDYNMDQTSVNPRTLTPSHDPLVEIALTRDDRILLARTKNGVIMSWRLDGANTFVVAPQVIDVIDTGESVVGLRTDPGRGCTFSVAYANGDVGGIDLQ